MRILVSRTDRIGDVVLTLPLMGLLRERLEAEVVALGRDYTRPVLEASPFVHEVLSWDAVAGAPAAVQRDFLRSARADVVLHVFPDRAIARAAKGAGIAVRIGTSHRLHHWLTANRLEHFTRKRSPLHEAQLNLRLARRLLGDGPWPLAELVPYGAIVPRVALPGDVERLLAPGRLPVVLHPKSRGSGREWPLAHWRALVDALDPARYQLLVTGSAAEGAELRPWLASLPAHATDLTGRLTLAELIALFARVHGAVAAGTGPLHIAAAAGANVVGLFPPTPPIHAGRWAPLGPRAGWLEAPSACASCAAGGGANGCTCMEAITPDAVATRIGKWAAR